MALNEKGPPVDKDPIYPVATMYRFNDNPTLSVFQLHYCKFSGYLSLSPIHLVPRTKEKIRLENDALYYVKMGLLGVMGSNPKLS